jgi:uncharacterized Rmd1/YagE family protein
MDDLHLRVRVQHDVLLDAPEARQARSRSAPRERPVGRLSAAAAAAAERERRASKELRPMRALLERSLGRSVQLDASWGLPPPPPPPAPPAEGAAAVEGAAAAGPALPAEPALPEEVPPEFQGPGTVVRARCYCLGAAFDRHALQDLVMRRARPGAAPPRVYPGALASTHARLGSDRQGEAFFLDFGCVVLWGLGREAERHVLAELAAPCLRGAVPLHARERDRLDVRFSAAPRTALANEELALHWRHADDLDMKLAVSLALAQSTKLSAHEAELRRAGRALAAVPAALAAAGAPPLPERGVLRAVGGLYRQMQAVTLLGSALADVPDAMAAAPTDVRALYKAAYRYLEVGERLKLLGDRFRVLAELLELCRTLGAQSHGEALERAILWLVAVCATIALFQLAGFAGWLPAPRGPALAAGAAWLRGGG